MVQIVDPTFACTGLVVSTILAFSPLCTGAGWVRMAGKLAAFVGLLANGPHSLGPFDTDRFTNQMINEPQTLILLRMIVLAMGLLALFGAMCLLMGLVPYYWQLLHP